MKENWLCFLPQLYLRHQLDVTCQHLGNFQARPLPWAKCIWQMDDKSLLFKGVCEGVVVEKTLLL